MNPERRLMKRFRTETQVLVRSYDGKRKFCKATNLSGNGVCIKTNNMNLSVGQTVDITFVINLGDLKKLHKREAVVKHVTNGMTGFRMEIFSIQNPNKINSK